MQLNSDWLHHFDVTCQKKQCWYCWCTAVVALFCISGEHYHVMTHVFSLKLWPFLPCWWAIKCSLRQARAYQLTTRTLVVFMHCRINQMPTFFRRSVFAATTRFKPLSISLFRQTQRCQLDRLIYNWNLVRMASFENANVRSYHDLLVSTAAPRAQYSAWQVAAPFVSRRCRPCSRSLRDYFVGVRFLMTTCLANNLQQGNTGGMAHVARKR